MPVTLCSKTCRECKEHKDLIYFAVRPDSKDGYRNDCKECSRLRTKAWTAKNPGRAKAAKKRCYLNKREYYKNKAKEHARKNPLKTKLKHAERYAKKSKTPKTKPKWAIDFHPKKSLAWSNLYRLKEGLTFCKQFIEETKRVYMQCPKNYHVDHIIPINNEFVSGLHVPWNLQYLTFEENLQKRNHFDGTRDNNSWKFKQCQ